MEGFWISLAFIAGTFYGQVTVWFKLRRDELKEKRN
jgi:hypothetical protein